VGDGGAVCFYSTIALGWRNFQVKAVCCANRDVFARGCYDSPV
jgi:hypothetical protein